MTLFDLATLHKQAGLARKIARNEGESEGLRHRINRAVNGTTGIDEDLIARCEAAFGDDFDRVGTLVHWYELRTRQAGSSEAQV